MADETTDETTEEKPKTKKKRAAKKEKFVGRRKSFHPAESLHRRQQMTQE